MFLRRQLVFVALLAGLIASAASPTLVRAQDGENPIRMHVSASEESSGDRAVNVSLPDEAEQGFEGSHGTNTDPGWNIPTHLREYYYDAKRGSEAVDSLKYELQRTSQARRLMRVMESREQANVFLAVVATEHGEREWRRRNRPVVVVRLSIRNHTYTTDFLGEFTDLVRPAAYEATDQIEQWVEDNYETLRQVFPGR